MVNETPARIFLMCDYSADPVWLDYGPMWPLEKLPLTESTRGQLREWAGWFETTLDTMRRSDERLVYFASDEEEQAFEREGLRLWQLVQDELADVCEVGYRSQLSNETLWPGSSPTGAAA